MVQFIDDYKVRYGVEPICELLPIAPSTYYRHKFLQRYPDKRNCRVIRDEQLCREILRVWTDSRHRYGRRKIYRQLNNEGISIARCTVDRLMSKLGIAGVSRGHNRPIKKPSAKNVNLPDLVNRQFKANKPNQLWVADFTYVASWSGWVYVAFVIDVYSRMIVGWRIAATMSSTLVMDALEQALWARQPRDSLIHHSDRGSQYLSICYTQKLLEKNILASVGRTGDAYDNALAETINGLYKAEVIYHEGPWKGVSDVEYATLEWVDWFNHQRLLEPLGYVSPEQYELVYHRKKEESVMRA